MFTGIINHVGTIEDFEQRPGGARLVIRHSFEAPLARGESVAVTGVCLTVLPDSDDTFSADLSEETLKRTTFGTLRQGARVNLERALAVGDRLGGHIVQGHVDAVGSLVSVETLDEFANFRWRFPAEYSDLVVDKGSIAIDGISLTIVDPEENEFDVAIIPETLERTSITSLANGEPVNLEFDVMAKYARTLFSRYLPGERD